ncbi:aminoglycoside phosphotransferase family protein [Streptomyces sp. TRM68416]|nr:aminoglycoside phosphotransferase family protein [Streptomyces sp. TRM68416]
MGAPPLPLPHVGERTTPSEIWSLVLRATQQGQSARGHHNQNYVLPVTEEAAPHLGLEAGTSVTVRMRQPRTLPVVIRTWQDEAAILDAVGSVLPAPKCLVRTSQFAIHSYVEGVPLSTVCGNGRAVDGELVTELAHLLARMTEVCPRTLPPLPFGWPRDHGDSSGFLRTLARMADRQIRQPNWDDFGGLFVALGVPEDALKRFADRVPELAPRPYSLLHADLHRDNLIVSYGGAPPLICVDWELATYGDPLHDLATHLVRMRYPDHQWEEVTGAWADAMERIHPAATRGMAKDLRRYVAFERAQSVYPDVMRAARSLLDSPDQRSLDEATASVHRALGAAAGPLELRNLPGEQEIETILHRWREARLGEGAPRDRNRGWTRDSRVPERSEFPDSAVTEALHAEGAAPANRVFKGTGHLNSVVRVPGTDFPVVVRRKVANVCRRERGYLSEHAVLRVIEESQCGVSAPRVLALGKCSRREPFAIHSYEGPPLDSGLRPAHPVDGLRLLQADCLVDQLHALTTVDYKKVDPTAGEGRFYPWLCGQLVELVAELPKESQQLARLLGLPDAERLDRVLAQYQVRERTPVLLHGDLNPWNLVCAPDGRGLTIIDWEMAVVGDPLYDLVRHIHLTPVRQHLRERMQGRWASRLAPEHTAGWRGDWRAYQRVEILRSAYVDLDRLVTGTSLDAPNVRRAVDAYAVTLKAAVGILGLRTRLTPNRFLTRALA